MVRLWHKPLLKPADVFTKEELEGIKKAVEKAERLTSGEIAVAIISECRRGLSAREQALQEFHRLGLDKTRGKTGILILAILQQRDVEILADKGINDKVPEGYWNEAAGMIVSGFKEGKPYDGVCRAVSKAGEMLADKFPKKPDDVNEIPDKVKLGE